MLMNHMFIPLLVRPLPGPWLKSGVFCVPSLTNFCVSEPTAMLMNHMFIPLLVRPLPGPWLKSGVFCVPSLVDLRVIVASQMLMKNFCLTRYSPLRSGATTCDACAGAWLRPRRIQTNFWMRLLWFSGIVAGWSLVPWSAREGRLIRFACNLKGERVGERDLVQAIKATRCAAVPGSHIGF